MTDDIADAARNAAGENVEIIAKTNTQGPKSIQGAKDGDAAVPGVLSLIESAENVDAAVIACFDDTGLSETRSVASFPVIGIGEASYILACILAPNSKFSVVTTLAVSIPVLEGNIERGGWKHQCSRVRASGIPVLALESDPGALDRLAEEISLAEAQDGVGAVVLGCAGMGRHLEQLVERTQRSIHLVEPVAAATRLALVAASSCTGYA
jgi:allantoin racemase